jgi:hypothetical protein
MLKKGFIKLLLKYDNDDSNFDADSIMMLNKMKEQLTYATDYLNEYKTIVQNGMIRYYRIMTFYEYVVKSWANIGKFDVGEIIQDICGLIPFIEVLQKGANSKGVTGKKSTMRIHTVYTMLQDCMLDSMYTSSVDIRYECAKTACSLLTPKSKKHAPKIVRGLIRLHNDIHNSNTPFATKTLNKIDIYEMIKGSVITSNLNIDGVTKLFTTDKNGIKLLNTLITDMLDLSDEMRNCYDSWVEVQDSREDDDDGQDAYVKYGNYYSDYITHITICTDFLVYFSVACRSLLLDIGVVSSFAKLLNICHQMILQMDDYKSDRGIKKRINKDIMTDVFAYKLKLLALLAIIYEHNPEFISSYLIQQELCFDYDMYNDIYTSIELDSIENGITPQILELMKKSMTDKEPVDLPAEFLDPITYLPIDDPVMLPDLTDLFIDKSVIKKQLLLKEENPFTGTKLTDEELDDYNKLPQIVKKIDDFKCRLAAWKKNNT